MSIAQSHDLLARKPDLLCPTINQHKIIAGTVHFGEFQNHGAAETTFAFPSCRVALPVADPPYALRYCLEAGQRLLSHPVFYRFSRNLLQFRCFHVWNFGVWSLELGFWSFDMGSFYTFT